MDAATFRSRGSMTSTPYNQGWIRMDFDFRLGQSECPLCREYNTFMLGLVY